jgi:hypothetical protein
MPTAAENVAEFGVMSPRAQVRDLYCNMNNRSHAIEFMASEDYDFLSKTLGRIEIVEMLVFNIIEKPQHFEFTQEEKHYFDWLREYFTSVEGSKLLGNIFLYGLPTETSFQLHREVA